MNKILTLLTDYRTIDFFLRQSLQLGEIETGKGMIDAVYTWVDSNDPFWLKEYQESMEAMGRNIAKSAAHLCRFRDYGELFYSLVSLNRFAPWIRKIFIVKKKYQTPNLHNLSQSVLQKIVWIDEASLCPAQLNPAQFSPTFNSLAIEANLHRIPGLSEQFIYFNNDMFLGNNVQPEFFFFDNSTRISLRQEGIWKRGSKNLLAHPNVGLIRGHFRHILNSYDCFNQNITSCTSIGIHYGSFPVHQCTPILKSSYYFAWEHVEIQKKLLEDSQYRFRSDKQLHPVFLVSLISLWLRKARIYFEEDVFIQLNKRQFRKQLAALTQHRAYRFCVNDNPRNRNSQDTLTTMTEFMNAYFTMNDVESVREHRDV